MIVSGSVIGEHPIVDMPHWGGILNRTEINDLIAYIHTLARPNNGTITYKPRHRHGSAHPAGSRHGLDRRELVGLCVGGVELRRG